MRFNNSIVSEISQTKFESFSYQNFQFQDYSKQNQFDLNGKQSDITSRIDYSNPPLKKLNLRANFLKGNIIVGNFTVKSYFN